MQGLEGTDRERVFKSYYPMQRATLKLEVGYRSEGEGEGMGRRGGATGTNLGRRTP